MSEWATFLRELANTQEKQQIAANLRQAAEEIERLSKDVCPVDGALKGSGVNWRLLTDKPVTPNDLRAIASQLHAVATKTENAQ